MTIGWRLLCVICSFTLPVVASGPSFPPDKTVSATSLDGLATVGENRWSARQGIITSTSAGGGGWLLLPESYQDVSFFTEFRCEGECEAGVLLRGEKTADGGLKGAYISFTEPDTPGYEVTVSAKGEMTKKEKLPPGGGLIRIAPPPSAGAGRFPRPPRPDVPLPIAPPDTSLRAGEWNSVEVFLDTNTIRSFLNTGPQHGAILPDGGYGPVALYAAGKGTVQFRGTAYADMSLKHRDEQKVGTDFRKQQLSDFYYSWGTAVADFNRDGVPDVVAGPYIYDGPDYRTSHEIFYALSSNPITEFSTNMVYADDFTGDGWPDVIVVSYGGNVSGVDLYVNPKGEHRRWEKFEVGSGVQSEIAILRDIDGDGKKELVYMGKGRVRYAKPDPAHPTATWTTVDVSAAGYGTAHGIGVGDINGDGRLDVLNAYGWWEQPATGAAAREWTYHPQAFAQYVRGIFGGSVMAVYDVNGDGLNDVVTSLDAHGWGLAWYEQKRSPSGEITFVQHMVMNDPSSKNSGGVVFSELHGTGVADVDGDGIPDFIAGKRYLSHLDTNIDPDPRGAPVLYWYRTVRSSKAEGGAELVPHLIDTHSGVGSDLVAQDLNGDGKIDVVVSTRLGTFIYWGQQPGHAARTKTVTNAPR